MRSDSSHINLFRNRKDPQFGTEDSDGMMGYFTMPIKGGDAIAAIIASPGCPEMPWEHVSVRIVVKTYHGKFKNRVPTWDEMCLIKDTFWGDDEVVMQLHPRKADYVNHNPCVLHLWKPVGVDIPTPPKVAV